MDNYFDSSCVTDFKAPENYLPQCVFSEHDIDIKNALLKIVSLAAAGADFASYLTELESVLTGSLFARHYERISLVLYTPGANRILITRRFLSGKWPFIPVLKRLLMHKRIHEFNGKVFYLQIDFTEVPADEINFYKVGMSQKGANHFEIGIDGLVITGEDEKTRVFLPGDAYVRSIMGMKQLREHLHNKYGEDYMRSARVERIRSDSFLLSDFAISPLYRGLPRVGSLSRSKLEHYTDIAIDHITQHFRDDHRFLYYYDAAQDSFKDFEHPQRDPEKNPYYNILRHSGGGLTCIFYEKHFGTGKTIDTIRSAIDYLKTQTVFYEQDGRQCGYIYSERKSKLGGAGLALYFVAQYQLLTGDRCYEKYAAALAWHLIGQITQTGEFIYYNIFLDKEISETENSQYFSFYYPGEALCGLAKYLAFAPEDEKPVLTDKIRQALDFLIHVRPIERAAEYSDLPSDSWLMIAIMELWDYPEFQQLAYSDFVFTDAASMISKMYKVTDAPYPDYAGAFYYQFGDYPYSDGARMEGLMGAYELAIKTGDQKNQSSLWNALTLGAWSVAHLVNTDQAIYPAKNPDIARGGIRFKYTRQWFRIDTIQHVASFYAKMLPYWEKA